MNAKSILIISSFIAVSLPAVAQRRSKPEPDTVKGATIEIIQSYKPELRQAPKPAIEPAMPPADTTRPVFTYDVPQQTLMYTYSSFPIRPLALGKDSVQLPYTDYIKAGVGNLSTFLLDAGIGRFKGEDYETALRVHHLSRAGRISDQKAMTTGLTATGTLHKDAMAHTAFMDISRQQYHYYGYDHELLTFPVTSVRQAFTDINFGFSTKNEGEGYMGLDYNPSIAISFYSDKYDASERSVDLNIPVSYFVDSSLTLKLDVNFLYARYVVQAPADIRQHNNIFQVAPAVHFRNDMVEGYAGIYPTIGKGGTAYLLPNFQVRYDLDAGFPVKLKLGYDAQLRQNTYEQLSTQNPFIYNTYNAAHEIRQTRTDVAYLSGNTNVGMHIFVEATLGLKQFRNLPLYINDTAGDMKYFNIIYDRVNAVFLEGAVRYQVANTIAIGLAPALYNFYKKDAAHVWHEPAIRLKGDVMIKPLENLTVTAYLSFMDGLHAIKKNNAVEKLNPVIDIGGAAEYNITDRISAFAQVNNLLNNKYQRWYLYDVFGFNLFGGARFKF